MENYNYSHRSEKHNCAMIIQNLLVDQFLGMTVECLVPVSFSVVLKSSYMAVTLVPLMEILLMTFFDRYNIFYQFSVLYLSLQK